MIYLIGRWGGGWEMLSLAHLFFCLLGLGVTKEAGILFYLPCCEPYLDTHTHCGKVCPGTALLVIDEEVWPAPCHSY